MMVDSDFRLIFLSLFLLPTLAVFDCATIVAFFAR